MIPPLEGRYRVSVLDRAASNSEVFRFGDDIVFGWSKLLNGVSEESLTVPLDEDSCCPFMFQRYRHVIKVERGDGATFRPLMFYDIDSLIHKPADNNLIVGLVSRLGLAYDRKLLDSFNSAGQASTVFRQLVRQAGRLDDLSLALQDYGSLSEVELVGQVGQRLAQFFSQLAGSLDFSETALGGYGHVVRFGELDRVTGKTLNSGSWESPPTVIDSGEAPVSAVTVVDNQNNPSIVGVWPLDQSGGLSRGTGLRFRPATLQVATLVSASEATAIAKRFWLRNQSGLIVGVEDSGSLSRSADVDVSTVEPGDIYRVILDGCVPVSADMRVTAISGTVADSKETAVEITLSAVNSSEI